VTKNIHIYIYVCVLEIIELKTHARNEKKFFVFYVSYETAGTEKNVFKYILFFLIRYINIHTHIHLRAKKKTERDT